MIERFEHGDMFSEKEWTAHIAQLRKQTKPSTQDHVKNALVDSIRKRIPNNHFGVFLSGGVDSALIARICQLHNANFTCYSVGTPGSCDLEAARALSAELGLTLVSKEYSEQDVKHYLSRAVTILDDTNPVHCSIASVIIAAADLAKKNGTTVFFGGLGAEEIFGGYQRHVHANDVNDECWQGLSRMCPTDFKRDCALAKSLGITVLVPFLDDNVILNAMGISGEHKVIGTQRKVILRHIAEELGVPHNIAFRHKKAAQYGSGFDKVLEKFGKPTKTAFLTTLHEM